MSNNSRKGWHSVCAATALKRKKRRRSDAGERQITADGRGQSDRFETDTGCWPKSETCSAAGTTPRSARTCLRSHLIRIESRQGTLPATNLIVKRHQRHMAEKKPPEGSEGRGCRAAAAVPRKLSPGRQLRTRIYTHCGTHDSKRTGWGPH